MVNAGYLTSNSDTAWPFDGDAVDPPLDRAAASFFADGSAVLGASERDFDVMVSDVSASASGLRFTVWKRPPKRAGPVCGQDDPSVDLEEVDSELGQGEYTVVRGVWFFFVIDNHCVAGSDGYFSAGPFKLDPSAVSAAPDKITSISLWNHGEIGPDGEYVGYYDDSGSHVRRKTHDGIAGAVSVVGGNNIYAGVDFDYGFGVTVPNIRPLVGAVFGNAFIIAAIPGEGDGPVPCPDKYDSGDSSECSQPPASGGSITPDSEGDFVIEGDDCHQISTYGNVIRITGRCTACCQCEAYKDTGDRLGKQSYTLFDIYNRSVSDSVMYNAWAVKFRDSLCRVRSNELIVKCVALTQRINAGVVHGVRMDNVVGSIDRGQGVITVGNASPSTVTADIRAQMSPQVISVANIAQSVNSASSSIETSTKTVKAESGSTTVPVHLIDVGTGNVDYSCVGTILMEDVELWGPCESNDSTYSEYSTDSTDSTDSDDQCLKYVFTAGQTVTQEMVDLCVLHGVLDLVIRFNSVFQYRAVLEPGSMLSIRLYGGRSAKTASNMCSILGLVNFSWVECENDDSSESADSGGVYRTLTKWFHATQEAE